MQRVSDIVGKSVVSADRGEKIGTVAELLMDRDGGRIVGVVVDGGLFRSERVLPYGEVQAIGDALIANSVDGSSARVSGSDAT